MGSAFAGVTNCDCWLPTASKVRIVSPCSRTPRTIYQKIMISLPRLSASGTVACALLLLSTQGARAQQMPSRAVVARVADSLATDFIAARGAPGVSIAIVRGRDTLVFGGWGKADLENDIQIGRAHV